MTEPGTEAGRLARHRHFSIDAPPLFCEECGKRWREVVDGRVGRRRRRESLHRRLLDAYAQRDLAVAHDRQPYPTAAAYEAVCAARDKWQAEAERLLARRAPGDQFDVERLARALIAVDLDADSQPTQHPDYWRWVADRVAQFEERDR